MTGKIYREKSNYSVGLWPGKKRANALYNGKTFSKAILELYLNISAKN